MSPPKPPHRCSSSRSPVGSHGHGGSGASWAVGGTVRIRGSGGSPKSEIFFRVSRRRWGPRRFFFCRAPCLAQPHPSLRIASSPGAAGMRALGAVPGCGGSRDSAPERGGSVGALCAGSSSLGIPKITAFGCAARVLPRRGLPEWPRRKSGQMGAFVFAWWRAGCWLKGPIAMQISRWREYSKRCAAF